MKVLNNVEMQAVSGGAGLFNNTALEEVYEILKPVLGPIAGVLSSVFGPLLKLLGYKGK